MNKYLRRQLGLKKAIRLAYLYRSWSSGKRMKDEDEFIVRDIRVFYKTRVPCSCYMCGHQRENFGKTYQELLSDIDWQEQIESTVFTLSEPGR